MKAQTINKQNVIPQAKMNHTVMETILQLSSPLQQLPKTKLEQTKQLQQTKLQYDLHEQEKIIENIKNATNLFNKKYFGNKMSVEGKQKKIILTNPTIITKKQNIIKRTQSQCLLPQMKEIQMIFKTQKKQSQKQKREKGSSRTSNYQDQNFTSYQLYKTKRNMLKESARLTQLKLQKNSLLQMERCKSIENPSMTEQKQEKRILKQLQKQSTPAKKIRSQRQLLTLFEQKIIKQKFQKPIFTLRQFLQLQKNKNPTQIEDNFQEDINQLTKVAKRMIVEHKMQSQIFSSSNTDSVSIQNSEEAHIPFEKEKNKSIQWVIKQCDRFKKKFTIRKSKSVSQMKKK